MTYQEHQEKLSKVDGLTQFYAIYKAWPKRLNERREIKVGKVGEYINSYNDNILPRKLWELVGHLFEYVIFRVVDWLEKNNEVKEKKATFQPHNSECLQWKHVSFKNLFI